MLIRLVVLIAGAVLMTAEVLAFRIVGRTFGTAIRETTAVIAVFLAAMSVGYFVGGRLGDRRPHLASLAVPLVVAGVWLLFLPGFDRPVSEAVATSSLPFATHGLVVSLVLFAVPTLALAATSPIAIRLILRDVAVAGSTSGQITALSTVGSIAGTLLGGFFLLGRFPISSILRGLAVILLLTALVIVILRWRRSPSARPAPPAVGALTLFVLLGLTPAAAESPGGFGWRVVFEQDSAYHHIVVEDRGDYRRLLFDDTRQSQMRIDAPAEGGFSYTRLFHTSWLFSDSIRSVLFIGLGGGTGPKQFLVDYPHLQVRVAEVDPAVVEVARRYFGLPDDERLTVEVIDGRVALRRNPETVDLIVVDAYSAGRYGATLPFHLTTDEFFKLAASRLNPEGMLLYNVVQQVGGRDDLIRALIKTLELTFAEVYVFETAGGGNSVVVALRTPRHLSLDGILARADSLVAAGTLPRPRLADDAANLYDGEIELGDVPVLTDDYAPVDRLLGR